MAENLNPETEWVMGHIYETVEPREDYVVFAGARGAPYACQFATDTAGKSHLFLFRFDDTVAFVRLPPKPTPHFRYRGSWRDVMKNDPPVYPGVRI